MSHFIEKSKHAAMTAAVTAHFGTDNSHTAPGAASGKGMPKGGTSDWNGTPMPFEVGGGVGYVPDSQAGHNMTSTRPFQGTADGLPGNSKKLWNK
jgi:hypothetical protein